VKYSARALKENPDEVKIYLNLDRGRTWRKQMLATTGSHSMRIVDVDGDGDMDLYGANWQGRTVELWENQTCRSPRHAGVLRRRAATAFRPQRLRIG
jgi:hypothetical protein